MQQDVWEVWITIDDIARVILAPTMEQAVLKGVKAFTTDKAVFDYLIAPDGAIRNDLVLRAIKGELRKQGRDKIKQYMLELKAQHRDDFWAVVGESDNLQQIQNKAATLAEEVGAERVRIRDSLPEG